jgi:O-antigen/teichoic acid export membrane protein
LGINFKKYKGLLAGSKYIFLLNLTDKLFSFIIMLLLARNFPTEIYGKVVTLITLSMVLISIFDLGLPIYIQREIAVNRLRASEIFSNVFILGSLLIIVYFGVSSAIVLFLYMDIPYTLFIIISLMMYTSFLVTISNKALSGINEYKRQFTAFLLPRILITGLFFAGVYLFSFSLQILLLVMFAGIAVNLYITIIQLRKKQISISFKFFNSAGIKKILAISLPLGIAVVFNLLYDKVDLLLISKLRGFDEAAFYSIAYGLFKSSSIAFSFLLVTGFTRIAELNREPSQVRKFLYEHAKLISIICVIVTIILFIFPELIITVFYTGKFEDSVNILRLLSIGIIAMGLNNLTGIILNGMGYFKIVMFITLYAFIMNVILNSVLIPKYGIAASAVLTVFTEFFILVIEWYYLKKILVNLQSKTS